MSMNFWPLSTKVRIFMHGFELFDGFLYRSQQKYRIFPNVGTNQ